LLHFTIFFTTTDVGESSFDIVSPSALHRCGHSLQYYRINARLNSFVCRNVSAWNSLHECVLQWHFIAWFSWLIDRIDFSWL